MKTRTILYKNLKFHGGRHINTHMYSDVVRGNKLWEQREGTS